jgi:hypothetical protein
MSHPVWKENEQVVYVTQHEQQYPEDDVEHDEALVRAVIRAIQRSPKLHAQLVIALEHKV